MSSKLYTTSPPVIDPCTIKEHLRINYGIEGELTFFPSDRDQIISVKAYRKQYILKVYNCYEDLYNVEMQILALNHIQDSGFPFEVPIPIRGPQTIKHMNQKYISCLFSFIDGNLLHDLNGGDIDIRKVGLLLGNLSHSLSDFNHEGRLGNFPWDIQNIEFIKKKLNHIKDRDSVFILKDFIGKYETNVLPIINKIRKSIIHNDGNKNNIVLDTSGQIKGIIDFGDMTKSLTVCEPAVCISYIIQNSKKYSIDVEQFLEGYLSVYNLNKYELRCIPYLVCMRLSISVTMAAWRKKLFPKNKYLTISEKPAWSLIHLLKRVDLENWI